MPAARSPNEVEALTALAEADEVRVGVDQAGGDELAVDVEDFGLRPDPAADLAIVADGNDSVAGRREGFRLWTAHSERDDSGVHDDEVRVVDGVGGDRRDCEQE